MPLPTSTAVRRRRPPAPDRAPQHVGSSRTHRLKAHIVHPEGALPLHGHDQVNQFGTPRHLALHLRHCPLACGHTSALLYKGRVAATLAIGSKRHPDSIAPLLTLQFHPHPQPHALSVIACRRELLYERADRSLLRFRRARNYRAARTAATSLAPQLHPIARHTRFLSQRPFRRNLARLARFEIQIRGPSLFHRRSFRRQSQHRILRQPQQHHRANHSRTSRKQSSVVTTVQYSPCRFARESECTSSAVRYRPCQSRRPNVNTASSGRRTSNPRLPAMRTVASTELFVVTPAITSRFSPACRNGASRSVPMKAELVRFTITTSPGSGDASGLKSLPGWPGR